MINFSSTSAVGQVVAYCPTCLCRHRYDRTFDRENMIVYCTNCRRSVRLEKIVQAEMEVELRDDLEQKAMQATFVRE